MQTISFRHHTQDVDEEDGPAVTKRYACNVVHFSPFLSFFALFFSLSSIHHHLVFSFSLTLSRLLSFSSVPSPLSFPTFYIFLYFTFSPPIVRFLSSYLTPSPSLPLSPPPLSLPLPPSLSLPPSLLLSPPLQGDLGLGADAERGPSYGARGYQKLDESDESKL